MVVIVDLKGCKLKDFSNKPMLSVYKQLTLEVQRFFPAMLHKMYILNAPLFSENIWDSELSQCVDEKTCKDKIIITSSGTHEDLFSEVKECELPQVYGGVCECEATCIYSEKGPWSEIENYINYKDPNSRRFADSDEEEDDRYDVSERNIGADFGSIKMMMGGGGGGMLNAASFGMKLP